MAFPLFSSILSLLSDYLVMMALLNRGQPLAWHTKVVHHRPGCLKAGPSKGVCGLDCDNDGMSSKPFLGRDITDGTQFVRVNVCGSSRCKACVHRKHLY